MTVKLVSWQNRSSPDPGWLRTMVELAVQERVVVASHGLRVRPGALKVRAFLGCWRLESGGFGAGWEWTSRRRSGSAKSVVIVTAMIIKKKSRPHNSSGGRRSTALIKD
jgi:hypothetical protein